MPDGQNTAVISHLAQGLSLPMSSSGTSEPEPPLLPIAPMSADMQGSYSPFPSMASAPMASLQSLLFLPTPSPSLHASSPLCTEAATPGLSQPTSSPGFYQSALHLSPSPIAPISTETQERSLLSRPMPSPHMDSVSLLQDDILFQDLLFPPTPSLSAQASSPLPHIQLELSLEDGEEEDMQIEDNEEEGRIEEEEKRDAEMGTEEEDDGVEKKGDDEGDDEEEEEDREEDQDRDKYENMEEGDKANNEGKNNKLLFGFMLKHLSMPIVRRRPKIQYKGSQAKSKPRLSIAKRHLHREQHAQRQTTLILSSRRHSTATLSNNDDMDIDCFQEYMDSFQGSSKITGSYPTIIDMTGDVCISLNLDFCL